MTIIFTLIVYRLFYFKYKEMLEKYNKTLMRCNKN